MAKILKFMNRCLKVHSIWGLVAVGTFAIGLYFSRFRESENSFTKDRTITEMKEEGQALPPGTLPPSGKDTPKHAGGAGEAYQVISPEAMEAMAKAALTDPNPVTRQLAFAKLLESMTPENVSMLMNALQTNRADGDQWRLFLYAWGAMDGRGALAHAATLEGREKARFLSGTIPGWAGKDPNSAIAWLDTLKEGDEKNRFRGGIVNGLADHDIGMATAYVMERSKAGDKEAAGYMEIVAGEEIRKKGAAGATTWAEQLPDGELKGTALEQVADQYVRENPVAAAALESPCSTSA